MSIKNDFTYKWSRLFASKRYGSKDGVVKLTPEEQQELLDDMGKVLLGRGVGGHKPVVMSNNEQTNYTGSVHGAQREDQRRPG